MQITRTTPLRRMTLQLRHIFLTDAETFIVFSFSVVYTCGTRCATRLKTRWTQLIELNDQLALKLAFFSNDSYC